MANNSNRSSAAIVLSVVFSTVVLLLAVLAAAYLNLNQPFMGYGLAGGFLFFLALRPRYREIFFALIASIALGTLNRLLQTNVRIVPLEFAFGILGLGTLLILGLRAIWVFEAERRRLLYALLPALVLGFLLIGSQYSLNLASMLYARTYDLYAYAFDGSLHWQPSFMFARQLLGHPLAFAVMANIYESIPLAMAALYAAHLSRSLAYHWPIIEVIFAAAMVGYIFFSVFPVAGPAHAFPYDFPRFSLAQSALPNLRLEMIPVTRMAPRNGVPSLHMSWALLIWWNLRGFRRWAYYLGGIYALLTAYCTLASGEHFLFDLVIAVPFSLAIQAAVTQTIPFRDPRRWKPVLTGSLLFLFWLLIGRFGIKLMLLTPILPSALVIASIALSLIWALRLPQLVPTHSETLHAGAPA